MGRELKRVALDFQWPLHEVWDGFLNPHYKHCKKCEACDGTGYSPEGKRLQDEWYGYVPFTPANPFGPVHPRIVSMAKWNVERLYEDKNLDRQKMYDDIVARLKPLEGYWFHKPDTDEQFEVLVSAVVSTFGVAVGMEASRLTKLFNGQWSHHLTQEDVQALVDGERLWDFTRRPRSKEEHEAAVRDGKYHENGYWLKEPNGYIPTAQEINEWSIGGFGHDSINCGICIDARAKREGIETHCPHCKGHGSIWQDEDGKTGAEWEKLSDEWKEIEPPAGEGYQIWETVSEGSPVSPVFATPEQLARWMVDNDTSITSGTSYAGWMKFITEDQWAPTMVGQGADLKSGVEAIGDGYNKEVVTSFEGETAQ